MAAFFLLVGLEIKREILEGQLASWKDRVLPGVGAVGGMIIPALIFALLSQGDPQALRGWAVPMATDIAFALGVLALLGTRVPLALKVLLTAIAIIDDLGAVLVIALFYADELTLPALAAAAAVVAVLVLMNRKGVRALPLYLMGGVLLWFCMLQSGVHATLAGVVLALTIPLRSGSGAAVSEAPLHRLEHSLHPWVAFLVLPVFGFANAGVSWSGVSLAELAGPVPLGMAFAEAPVLAEQAKMGVLLGSMLSGVAGVALLLAFSPGR